jgi:hypothetical protein
MVVEVAMTITENTDPKIMFKALKQLNEKIKQMDETIKKQSKIIEKLRRKLRTQVQDNLAVQVSIKNNGYGYLGNEYQVYRTYPLAGMDKDRDQEQLALDVAIERYGEDFHELYYHEKYGWVVKLKPEKILTTDQENKLIEIRRRRNGESAKKSPIDYDSLP